MSKHSDFAPLFPQDVRGLDEEEAVLSLFRAGDQGEAVDLFAGREHDNGRTCGAVY